ncbi:MAG: exopolysaccharide biosynthesis polyprenyl glycosylphosphotransferase [Spirochaetia bacterium]|nr:exopolysaccharide biosynthesis polyprenyl glycosylphosphotransferase [Spirochaetia bacterium]
MEASKDYANFVMRVTADIITILSSWFFAYFLRFYVIPGGIGEPLSLFSWLSLLVLALFLFFLNKNRLYLSSYHTSWQEEIQLVFFSSLQSFLSMTVFLYFFLDVKVSRVSISLYFVMVTLFLILERVVIKNVLAASRMRSKVSKTVLLVGEGKALKKYIKAAGKVPESGVQIIGQFDGVYDVLTDCHQYDGDLVTVIEDISPDIIVIGYSQSQHKREREIVALCYNLLQTVILLPNIPFSYIGTQVVNYNQLPVLYLNHVNLTSFQKVGKRMFDVFLSIIGIVALSPLMILLAILVKNTSKGPVFFKQKRVTEQGKVFTMLKFRSMASNDNAFQKRTGSSWTVKNDPRITKLGSYIRRTSLDELPQLFNVFAGDMSLIGPRPERPELVDQFIQEIPGYQLRHKVKAGLSGWAQVNGWRGNTSLAQRIEFDLFYIRNWSFTLDVKIVLMTLVRGFVNKNAY